MLWFNQRTKKVAISTNCEKATFSKQITVIFFYFNLILEESFGKSGE